MQRQLALLQVLFILLAHCPVRVAKYVVYPLYMGDDGCDTGLCDDDMFTCDHTCYMHGLQCSTESFDCHAEAVKYCGGKELTMLIRGTCDTDLCDVSYNAIYLSCLFSVLLTFQH
jgi:hypothetical protein